MYLYAVTADRLVTGPGEKTCWQVWERRHQQTVDFVCVTSEHCLALPALDKQRQNINLIILQIIYWDPKIHCLCCHVKTVCSIQRD